MNKNKILSYSKRILDAKNEIELANSSLESFNEEITYKLDEDEVARNMMVDQVFLINGLTTEYRNIYGIEAPTLSIKKCKLGVDKYGADIMTSGDYKNEYYDCPEAIYAALYDESSLHSWIEVPGADKSEAPIDQQNFFIDQNKTSEYSDFTEPFNAPGLNAWAGTYLYNNICKPYQLTEPYLHDLLTNHHLMQYTYNMDGAYSEKKPFSYYIGSDADIHRHQFHYHANESTLRKEYNEHKENYTINSVTDTKPIEYYTVTIEVESEAHQVEDPVTHEITTYYTYKRINDPFSLIKIIEGEEVEEIFNTLCTKLSFNGANAVAILHRDTTEEELPEIGYTEISSFKRHFYIDVLAQTKEFFPSQEVQQWQKQYAYIYLNNDNKRYSSKEVIFSPLTDTELTSAIAAFLSNMYSKVIFYYNYFVNEVGSDVTIDLQDSINTMNAVINTINSSFAEAFDARINYIKGGEVPYRRAKAINSFLLRETGRYHKIFLLLSSRISKACGSLRELTTISKNISLSSRLINLKKKNLNNLIKLFDVFQVSSGFGTKALLISKNSWEPDSSVYSSLSKGSCVSIVTGEDTVQENTVYNISKVGDCVFSVTFENVTNQLDIDFDNPRIVKEK